MTACGLLIYFATLCCIFLAQKEHLPGVTVSLILMPAFSVAISSKTSYAKLLVCRKNTFLVSLILMTAFPVAISSPPSYTVPYLFCADRTPSC
jgi:hypothetical protein